MFGVQSIRTWVHGSGMRGPFRAGISACTTTEGHRNDPRPRFSYAPFPFGGISRTRLRGRPDDLFLTVGDVNSAPLPLNVSTDFPSFVAVSLFIRDYIWKNPNEPLQCNEASGRSS